MGSLAWRILIALATVAGTLIVLSLVKDAPSEPQYCVDSETRERMRTLAFEGYDQAFKEHMIRLYGVWLKDPADQPKRAQKGSQDGVRAYLKSRELTLNWDPPPCPMER